MEEDRKPEEERKSPLIGITPVNVHTFIRFLKKEIKTRFKKMR